MKILSVYPWTHVSSSALMVNGKLVAASPEERFNRIKWSTSFPIKSANWCLNFKQLKWDNIDIIAIPWNPAHNINSTSNRWDSDISWRGQMLSNIPSNIMKALKTDVPNTMEVKFGNTKILYLNHHDCHAASAVLVSPFKKCDYLTIDGHGETETCMSGYYEANKFIRTNSILYPHSVGLLYGTFTDFLGFKPDSDEWKTMALASFSKKKGVYDDKINLIYKLTENGFEMDLSFFDYYLFDKKPNFFNKKFIELFGIPRKKNGKLLKKHFEISGALQRAFEKIVFHLLKITKVLGGKSGNIAIAGGAAMNCVFNGLLEKNNIYNNNFIPPWPDDLGVSVGATYLVNNNIKKRNKNLKRVCSVYLGPSYSKKEIFSTLKKYNLNFHKPKNLQNYVANKLANGHLVGWFQDRMEFSHRALGNRSILADPRRKQIQKKVNSAVKYRESFRPFAPAIMEEKAYEIFDIRKKTKIEFMEKAVLVRKKWRKKIPAVTHIDGTARVQTVSKNVNPKFYNLINAFYQITDIPVLLNTSFNLSGEPIVTSPADAIRTFYTCGLDVLVIGDYVIEK